MKRTQKFTYYSRVLKSIFFALLLGIAIQPNEGHAQDSRQFIEIPNLSASNDSVQQFHMSINLGYQSPRDSFDVRIVFPEYRTLSKDESARLIRQGVQIPQQLTYTTHQGYWKKQTIVTLNIIPYIQQDQQIRQLTSFKIDTLKKAATATALYKPETLLPVRLIWQVCQPHNAIQELPYWHPENG